MVHTAAEALAAVQAADGRVDSLIALFATTRQQLLDARGNALTPEVQAAIDSVFDVSTADAAKMDAALQS